VDAVAALARWTELVQRPEAEIPLDEAALLISASANPALDVTAQLERLDALGSRVDRADVDSLLRVLFEQERLRGDRGSYHGPDNSYLDRVLDRRLGIPISLAVVLLEVGRRAGVALDAVGMPGHFLVRDPARPHQLIDPFDAGQRLDLGACERLLQAATGDATHLSPEMLATSNRHAILARMLANLDRNFAMRQDRTALSWLCDLRMALPVAAASDRTQLAGRLARLGRFDVAAAVLEDVAGALPAERVAARLLAQAATFRARLN